MSAHPQAAPAPSARAPRTSRPRLPRPRMRASTALLILVTIVFVFPFFWILTRSFMSTAEYGSAAPRMLPKDPTLSNYDTVLGKDDFVRNVLNSAIVATLTTAITLVLGSLAGYALARLPIRGKPVILAVVTLAGFFPLTAMIGPLFTVMQNTGLLNTYIGLSISDLIYTLPLTTWLLATLFAQLPQEIEEAAMVDGCTRLGALRRVVLPLAAPALATAGIFSFILAWSDFAFSLSFLETPDRFTAPLAIVALGQSKYQTFYNLTDAAVVVTALPIAALVLVAQRRIVAGLTAGAVR
jgi:trehalose/maltose transport system permease protein